MSLQVWLPLDGDLHNQGLNQNITFQNSGTLSYTANGKIGSTWNNSGSTYIYCDNVTLGKSWSIACWSKGNTNSKMMWVATTASSDRLNLYLRQSIYCLNSGDGGQNTFRDNNNVDVVAKDANWHHFVVVFKDNEKAKLYIDGEYAGSAVTYKDPSMTNARLRFGGGYEDAHTYDWVGYLNDCRVYDHALSPREVKEIAQAKILHYPLNNNGAGFVLPQAYTKLEYIASNGTQYIDTEIIPTINTCVKCSCEYTQLKSTFTGPFGSQGSSTITNAFRVASTSSVGYIGIGNKEISFPKFNINERYYINFNSNGNRQLNANGVLTITNPTGGTFTASTTKSIWIFNRNVNGAVNNDYGFVGKIYFLEIYENNVLIKKYIPAKRKSDNVLGMYELISQTFKTNQGTGNFTAGGEEINIKYQSNIEYDISGFNNHADKVGTLLTSQNTKRYNTSTQFGTSSYLNAGRGPMVTDEITVSLWGYMSSWAQNARSISCLQTGGWGFEKTSTYIQFSVYCDLATPAYKTAKFSGTLTSGWHHIVGTYDGFIVKLYIDGVKKAEISTGATNKTAIKYNATNSIFIGAEAQSSATTPTTPYFDGLISDARIYATALSDNDILELYNMGI